MSASPGKKGRASKKDAVIGRKLREIRYWRNLSQEELAAKVNITFQQIQKYEIGTNRISAGRLHDLSQILEVSIEDFFAGLESRTEGNNALPVQPRKELIKLMQSYERLSKQERAVIRILLKVMNG
jgi:transcriptional regulator with XRE-family HTH domain